MRSSISTVAALLAIFASAGCDTNEGLTLPAISITNTWDVEGEENRDFGFTSTDDGRTEGTFTGTEFVGLEDENPLTGWWAGGEIRFTVQRTGQQAVYSGTIPEDLPDRFTVHSNAETITLVRQPQN